MIVEGNSARISLAEANYAAYGAELQHDTESLEYISKKLNAYEDVLDSAAEQLDQVPQNLAVIEFPALPELIEKFLGHIAAGKESLAHADAELVKYASGEQPEPKRPKQVVKARHRAPHLKLIKGD